jgi:exodeoxyribonuclease V alpha subunit
VLQRVYRFERETEIPRLARLVRDGEPAAALELLRGQPAGIAFEELGTDEDFGVGGRAALRDRLVAHETAMISAAAAGEVTAALDALDEHRLLCAHRAGPRGVRHWTEVVERALATGGQIAPRADGHYAGQPLLVVANDYDTGLFNGDTGVIVQRDGELLAAFRRGSTPELFTLVRLAAVRPLHAMTVHRAQGSQFREVTVLLPISGSPLATRQTFYTAITRAERRVRVTGSAASVLSSIERLAARATGLRDRLDGTLTDG